MKIAHWLAPFTLAGIMAAPAMAEVPNAPTGPVETKYYADGPFQVTMVTTGDSCDHKGNVCDIWYPAESSGAAKRRPLVLWANGTSDTAVTPDKYDIG